MKTIFSKLWLVIAIYYSPFLKKQEEIINVRHFYWSLLCTHCMVNTCKHTVILWLSWSMAFSVDYTSIMLTSLFIFPSQFSDEILNIQEDLFFKEKFKHIETLCLLWFVLIGVIILNLLPNYLKIMSIGFMK